MPATTEYHTGPLGMQLEAIDVLPTSRVLGKQLSNFLAAHPGFKHTIDTVFDFYCNHRERSQKFGELASMSSEMFHNMIRDAGLLNPEFTQCDANAIEQEAKPYHRPRFSREHYISALALIAGKKFHSIPSAEAVSQLISQHLVPLANRQLTTGTTESSNQPPEVNMAYQYDDFLRFIYFYYTQESRMMRVEDFTLFAEDFHITPDLIEPAELGHLFQVSGNKVRAGHMSYSEFVLCLARCSVRAGGAGRLELVRQFFEDIVRSKEYAGVETWHESLEWAPTQAAAAPQQCVEASGHVTEPAIPHPGDVMGHMAHPNFHPHHGFHHGPPHPGFHGPSHDLGGSFGTGLVMTWDPRGPTHGDPRISVRPVGF